MITGEERQKLIDIAAALEVDVARIRSLIDEPQAPTSPTQFTLSPGDRVAFTGSLDIPYEIWAQRAAAAGLDVGDVTRKCVLLVAANPDTMSGKAQKACAHGVPIVGEAAFAKFLSALERDGAAQSTGDANPEVAAHFPWLSADQVRAAGSSRSRIAAAWIALHPTQPLHMLASDLRPHHTPEATGRRHRPLPGSVEPAPPADAQRQRRRPAGPSRRWREAPPQTRRAGGGPGHGRGRGGCGACGGCGGCLPDPTEPWPSFDDEPATDPTPEELLAQAQASSYHSYAVPAPSVTTPLEPMSASLPVERTNRAAKVFKWSAITAVASFFLFGVCLETFDPEAESFIAGVFVVGVLLGGLTAAVSGIWALVNRLRR